jgi:hypothetical protein
MLKLSLGRARRIGGLLLALGLGSAASSTLVGCGGDARVRYPTTDNGLKLERVVLYRNGVGYFERAGKVDGDVLRIRVRKDQVNDLLKSLTVVEREGRQGRERVDAARSADLGERRDRDARAGQRQPRRGARRAARHRASRCRPPTARSTGPRRHRRGARRANDPRRWPGRSRSTMPPSRARDFKVTLLDAATEVVRLSKVTASAPQRRHLAMQFHRSSTRRPARACSSRSTSRSASPARARTISGELRRRGADVEADLPRRAARVRARGKALLQGWAVVDNTSGEDWRDVKLG